jgi:predicted ATPase
MERARAEGRRALEEARATGQAYLCAVVRHHLNVLAQIGGDIDALDQGTGELLRLAQDHGFAHWHATATLLRGWLVAARGELAQGLGMMQRGLSAKVATGSRLKLPYYHGLMAEMLAQLGQTSEARALIDAALEQAEQTGERWILPELLRLRAQALIGLRGGEGAAEACLRDAIRIAHGQTARLWELRAATALAQLRSNRDELGRGDGPKPSGHLRLVRDLAGAAQGGHARAAPVSAADELRGSSA